MSLFFFNLILWLMEEISVTREPAGEMWVGVIIVSIWEGISHALKEG